MSVFASVPAPELPPKVLNAPAKVAVTQSVGGTTISVATDPKLGKILVGEKGMTLYIFTKDWAEPEQLHQRDLPTEMAAPDEPGHTDFSVQV